MKWPLKTSSDVGGWREPAAGGAPRTHQRRGTYTDYRCDSLGSAAEWDRSLEGTRCGKPREFRVGARQLFSPESGTCVIPPFHH